MATTKKPFVIISNRLPISVSKKDGKLVFSTSSGGLATAMSSLGHKNKVWIGWPGVGSEDLTAAEKTQITREFQKYDCYPVHLTNDQIQNFYEGYSNDTLWPLFHYFQGSTVYQNEYWQAYKTVNRAFAAATKRVSEPDATIWIQDYHLMLLPAMVRKQLPDSSIGFFLHIPFPSYEIFRQLPERKEILEGLLGADLIGFHIYDYARHFLSSVLRIVGASHELGTINYNGRTIKADSYPIGIDYRKFRHTLNTPAGKTAISVAKDSHADHKVILSVDRLDYSKGITRRLEAYQLFLEQNPEFIGKVKLVMVAVPSRVEVTTYKNLRDTIEQTVSRINGMFGTIDWAPISYQFQNLPFEQIVALYNISDVALITPLRDGMNLVAKEYVASKTTANPGVLILSEMTGAIDELAESIRINPNDTHMVAKAIKNALTMSKSEKLKRQKSMQTRIADYSVQRWGADFVSDLTAMNQKRISSQEKLFKNKDFADMRDKFVESPSRLLLLDYDGTLQTFKSSFKAKAAKPSRKIVQLLVRLSKKPDTEVCVISGRSKKALEEWFGATDLTLIAEHGAWVRRNGAWTQAIDTPTDAKAVAKPIMEKYLSRTSGSRLEEKDFSLVWHFRNVPSELAFVRSSELKRELTDALVESDMQVHRGNCIIEVKPKKASKGDAVRSAKRGYAKGFILCAGDDYTDEDMFAELADSTYTFKIGLGKTQARFRMEGVEHMVRTLEKLDSIKF